jgi:2'-5' RNA ligase
MGAIRSRQSGRLFYVVYPSDPFVQAALDGVRLLSDPSERQRAHITVRGPYSPEGSYARPRTIATFSEQVEGKELTVTGVGRFFGKRQNTVFFECESQALRAVWGKRDYPDFTPHITLYDGPSRDLAERLLETVSANGPPFSFAMSGIEPMISIPGQQGGLSLLGVEKVDFLGQLAAASFDPLRIDELSATARLRAVARLCDFLATVRYGKPSVTDGRATM